MLKLDWNLVFTIINLIVLYLLMRKFLIKPVTGIMEKRKELIASQLAEATQAQTQANDLKAQYEANLSGAKQESGQIMDQARKDAKAEYDRVVKEADAQAGKIIETARATMEAERGKTIRELKTQIAGLAMEAAEKITADGAGSAQDSKMYDQFLAEAGEEDDTDGH